MGLDQYAYSAARAGQYQEYYELGEYDQSLGDFASPVTKYKELAYWRKHPNLQGWMENLWISQGNIPDQDCYFNGVELELTWQDLDRLEQDILSGKMTDLNTVGFFFGDPSDDYYRAQDLKFIRDARAELFLGLKVFYNSSW